jgi:hypothetical protein
MNLKRKIVASAAALVLAASAGTAAAMSAGAATPSCGTQCLNIYNKQFGKQFITDVFRQGARTGQPIILFQRSNSDPALDFTVSVQGTVSDFYASGLVSSQVELHYGGAKYSNITTNTPVGVDELAGEIEYAPRGADSGLCIGVPTGRLAATGSAKVSLQPCGEDGRTVWILDGVDICNNFAFGQAPLINGADTNFSHPSVLTYPASGNPVDKPRPQLLVKNLTGFSQNGPPSPNPSGCQSIIGSIVGPDTSQLWSAYLGIAK